jgi:proline dehydrogenase
VHWFPASRRSFGVCRLEGLALFSLAQLAQSDSVRSLVTRLPVAKSVVGRFVAGERVEDAVRAASELGTRGLMATVDHLGENVGTEAEATRATGECLELLDALGAAHLEAHVSVKLSQLGLDLSDEIGASNLRRLVERARDLRTFVRVDMEGTAYTDRILRCVRAMKAEGHQDVGVVIQAYLYRSAEDVAALCEEGIRVRLCKGAYNEPADKAFPKKSDVDANYVKLAEALLSAAKRAPGLYPALATHDEKMIDAAKRYAKQHEIPATSFEFQMLYGIRRDLQDRASREGFKVRIYIPYGTEWYPYFMRRLAERPANLWFFVSNLLKR